MIRCRYCESEHGDLLLCTPAKKVLDALYARGQRFDLPTVELVDPIVTDPGAMGANTVLVEQFVAKAAVADVAGTSQPILILTGRALGGKVLPEWYLPASPADMRKHVKMINDIAEMAIRRAHANREEAERGTH